MVAKGTFAKQMILSWDMKRLGITKIRKDKKKGIFHAKEVRVLDKIKERWARNLAVTSKRTIH